MTAFVRPSSLVTRVLILILTALLLFPLLLSCEKREGSEKNEIVCTIYPIYDFVLNVLGSRASDYSVRLLSDDGNDPHNLQPSVSDIAALSEAAIVFYVGGASDAWIGELPATSTVRVPLIDFVTVCESDHGEGHGHEGHDHGAYDEHFWLSLRSSAEAVEKILSVLSEVFSEDTEAVSAFLENARAYILALTALDARYEAALSEEKRTFDTLLVADRFPFLYLAHDYGLHFEAAFPGCSSECDASFSTVISLVSLLRDEGLPAVLVTETGAQDLAKTVIREAGREDAKILVLHSCQAVTAREIGSGITYLSIMEQNLSVLISVLSE